MSGSAALLPSLLAAAALCGAAPAAAGGPTVASINVCTDQLVLSLADSEQILTLSWLSADPEESTRAAEARRYPLNYGSAEELLRYRPDVVIAGSFTSAYARALLTTLGREVVEIPPADGIDGIERNIAAVASAVGRQERGEALIESLRQRRERLIRARPSVPVRAVVVRPGGFTAGRGSLADEMMRLAGLVNVPAERGLDRWGSLSMETLLRSDPDLLIMTGYRSDQASLANTVFDHAALGRLLAETPAVTVPAAQWSCGLPESLDSVDALQRAAARLRAAPGERTSDAGGVDLRR